MIVELYLMFFCKLGLVSRLSYSRLGKEKTKEVNTQVIVLNWNLVELWNSPADASVDGGMV